MRMIMAAVLVGILAGVGLAVGSAQAASRLPAWVPNAQMLWGLGEFYRELCEDVGGEYFADPNLLAQTDIQYWRCEGGDWCGTYPNLPLCRERGDAG